MGNKTNSMEISKSCHQMDYVIFKEIAIDCFLYDPLSSVLWRTDMAYPVGGTNIRQKDTLKANAVQKEISGTLAEYRNTSRKMELERLMMCI